VTIHPGTCLITPNSFTGLYCLLDNLRLFCCCLTCTVTLGMASQYPRMAPRRATCGVSRATCRGFIHTRKPTLAECHFEQIVKRTLSAFPKGRAARRPRGPF